MRVFAIVALLGLTSSPAVASPDQALGLPEEVYARPSDPVENTDRWAERLANLFDEGVLHDEGKRPRGVVKWRGPIDVSIRGDAAKAHAYFLEDILFELQDLTGVEMTLSIDQNWAGDIDIYITYLDFYRPFFLTSHMGDPTPFSCAAMPWSIDGAMRRSQIRINAGAVGDQVARACLVEEVVQSMGLMGEVDGETATLLHDGIGYEGLGILDRMMLRTLYDSRLVAGMNREDALPIARDILDDQLAAVTCSDSEAVGRRCDL